jgi:hypothetical protein
MGKVVVQASMSLDGFIADTNDHVGAPSDWYGNGDVKSPAAIRGWSSTCHEPVLTLLYGMVQPRVRLRCSIFRQLRRVEVVT